MHLVVLLTVQEGRLAKQSVDHYHSAASASDKDDALLLLLSQDFNAFVAAGITTFDAAGELHCLHQSASPGSSPQQPTRTTMCVFHLSMAVALLATLDHDQTV